ncbi:MAG: DUF445 family protein [Deltaproteobacteria bacterium]|nr:DUF445 family protein [Deltaproteobacteria bacterium]
MDYRIFIPPITGAVIGWFTHYVAIKMLFRPYRPVNLLGYKLQGLIPKRRKEIAAGIAKTIERELVSAKDFSAILQGIEWKEDVEKAVDEIVEHRFKAGKIKKIPLIGLISENLTYHIKYLLTKEVIKHIDEKKDSFVEKFHDKVNMKEMLVARIDNLDIKRFEALLTDFIARELRHIEWLGGALGFIIGVIQVGIVYLL